MTELILLFEPKRDTKILDQLSKAIDRYYVAGSINIKPSLVLVSQDVWFLIDGELQPLLKARYQTKKSKGYEKISGKRSVSEFLGIEVESRPIVNTPLPKEGYNALMYRALPIVAIAGKNIVADRVGANNQ